MRSPMQFDHALIRRGKAEVVAAALANGMKSLKMDGFEKVRMGWTTVEEIMRVIFTAGA